MGEREEEYDMDERKEEYDMDEWTKEATKMHNKSRHKAEVQRKRAADTKKTVGVDAAGNKKTIEDLQQEKRERKRDARKPKKKKKKKTGGES